MGLFSNLFGKKKCLVAEKVIDSPNVEVIVEEKIVPISKDNKKDLTIEADHSLPQLQGDYAKVVFLWANQKPSVVKMQKDYAKYFLYECGIKDIPAYHRNLISEGYFKETSMEVKLSALKVTDLKELLKTVEQSPTGKKDELIKRIIQYVPMDMLEKTCPEKTYELSDKGKAFLDAHKEYVLLHKYSRWEVDWQEYNKNHKDGESFYDTMWRIFNQRILQDTRLFGRTEYYNMYQLLAEEGKRKNALEMLLRVLYLDLSGMNAVDNFRFYKQGYYTKQEMKEHYGVAFMLAPGIVYPIAEFADIYDETIVDRLYEHRLPVQLCDKELFNKIVKSIIDDTYNEKKTEQELKKAYYKLIDSM